MGPRFPEKQRLGLGLGGCANHQPFPENLCAHSSVDAGTETPKPNWNSFLHISHILHVRQIQEPECMKARQPANPARPLNVNQVGVQENFRHLRFWTYSILQYILYFWFLFVLHCVFAFAFFVHLWFPFFCIFFLQLLFVCIFKIHFVALHAAFFHDSNF